MATAVDTNEIIKQENLVYNKTKVLKDKPLHYCPGCPHGTVHKLLAEAIEELDIQQSAIGISPVGCAVFAYDYIDVDWQQAAHGRAPALATAVKRMMPDKHVFTYQGDGDLAAIGTAEILHACNRGEGIVVIFINNGIYGMTGGQMAPTTIEGMQTSTSPSGRETSLHGHPLKMTDLVAQLPGTRYVARHEAVTAKGSRKLKKAFKRAFNYSQENKGTSFIEIVSSCSSGWKLSPTHANKWMKDNMIPYYPLGDLKHVKNVE